MELCNKQKFCVEYKWSESQIFYTVPVGVIFVNLVTGESSYCSSLNTAELKHFIIEKLSKSSEVTLTNNIVDRVSNSILTHYHHINDSNKLLESSDYVYCDKEIIEANPGEIVDPITKNTIKKAESVLTQLRLEELKREAYLSELERVTNNGKLPKKSNGTTNCFTR